MLFEFEDILIMNFSFAECTVSKRKPVMVLKDTKDGDLLVCKVTSKKYNSSFVVSEWRGASLLSPSVVRLHKIQTISNQLVFGKLGYLSLFDKRLAKNILLHLLCP